MSLVTSPGHLSVSCTLFCHADLQAHLALCLSLISFRNIRFSTSTSLISALYHKKSEVVVQGFCWCSSLLSCFEGKTLLSGSLCSYHAVQKLLWLTSFLWANCQTYYSIRDRPLICSAKVWEHLAMQHEEERWTKVTILWPYQKLDKCDFGLV